MIEPEDSNYRQSTTGIPELKTHKPLIESKLSGKVIAVPESRQLDVLSALFERRGASVLRIPLITIFDAPEQGPVVQWLREFINDTPDYFIVLTGEGLRRLRAVAVRQQLESQFRDALQRTCKICRGPKPGRALKEMGLQADVHGAAPTTSGIITTLDSLPLEGRRVAVQLYGEDPNTMLRLYLRQRNLASCDMVAPYIYASDSDTERVKALIQALAAGQIDLLAFTSQPQVHRLFDVALKHHLHAELSAGMRQVKIAAIGPIVSEALKAHGCQVDVMPAKSYFMKPLVTAAEQIFADDAQ